MNSFAAFFACLTLTAYAFYRGARYLLSRAGIH